MVKLIRHVRLVAIKHLLGNFHELARGAMVQWLERSLVDMQQEDLGSIPAQTKCFLLLGYKEVGIKWIQTQNMCSSVSIQMKIIIIIPSHAIQRRNQYKCKVWELKKIKAATSIISKNKTLQRAFERVLMDLGIAIQDCKTVAAHWTSEEVVPSSSPNGNWAYFYSSLSFLAISGASLNRSLMEVQHY